MRQCAICHKGSVLRGKRKLLRGHHNPTAISRRYPNLQYAKVGESRKLVCASCLKSLPRTAEKSR